MDAIALAAYAEQLLPHGKAAVCCNLPRGIVWTHRSIETMKNYIDGLMRKLRNSKFGQGFWFVGGNSDSPSSEEVQISNNLD